MRFRISGGLCVLSVGLVAAKIGVRGLVETAFAVDVGVDLVIRKNEAIFGRVVWQALHFTKLEKFLCVHDFLATLLFAGGLQGLEQDEVFLQTAVDALLVEGQEFEVFRLDGEDTRGDEGGMDFRVFGDDFARAIGKAYGEEVVFDGRSSG
jgi:hypothetical protein